MRQPAYYRIKYLNQWFIAEYQIDEYRGGGVFYIPGEECYIYESSRYINIIIEQPLFADPSKQTDDQ